MRQVSGVILAAGSSRRLGRPKQLLDLGGEPLLRHTVRHAVGSSLHEVIVVLGSRSGEIAAAVGELGQRTVVNAGFAAGQSTSLVLGIGEVSVQSDGMLVMLGDQPMVSAAAVDRLIGRFRRGGGTVVQAAYGGEPGNPVLFGRSLFDALAAVSGDEGARSAVRRHRDSVVLVDVGDVAEVIDVDTEADYARLIELWEARTHDRGS